MLTSQSWGSVLLLWTQHSSQGDGGTAGGCLRSGSDFASRKASRVPVGPEGLVLSLHMQWLNELNQGLAHTQATTKHWWPQNSSRVVPHGSWDLSLCELNPILRERRTKIQALVVSLELVGTHACYIWERTSSWVDLIISHERILLGGGWLGPKSNPSSDHQPALLSVKGEKTLFSYLGQSGSFSNFHFFMWDCRSSERGNSSIRPLK